MHERVCLHVHVCVPEGGLAGLDLGRRQHDLLEAISMLHLQLDNQQNFTVTSDNMSQMNSLKSEKGVCAHASEGLSAHACVPGSELVWQDLG